MLLGQRTGKPWKADNIPDSAASLVVWPDKVHSSEVELTFEDTPSDVISVQRRMLYR